MPKIPRYRLGRAIARTGAGEMYEATEAFTERDAVVEVASELESDTARSRFMRDAMTAQRLDGEHIVRVLDVGQLADGTPYAVREPLVASLDLEIRTRGPISADQAVGWTLEACEAVAEGHALGLVHGSIRPDRLFLAHGKKGDLVVKLFWSTGGSDYRADIAGLGDVLRALLSGQVDLTDEDRARTLPTPLADIIVGTMSLRPDARFKNVADLAHALAPFAPDHPSIRNVSFLLSRAGIAVPRTAERPSDEWFASPPRDRLSIDVPPPERRPGRFAAVALGVVAVVAVTTALLWRTDRLPQWTGAADPADLYGTTSLTSADIAKEQTSGALAEDVADEGIERRSVPIAASMVSLPPFAKATTTTTAPEAKAPLGWSMPPTPTPRSDDAVRTSEPLRTDEVPTPTPTQQPSKAAPTEEPMPFPPVPEPAPPSKPERPDREP